jgi:hypothetical protein
MLNPSSPIWPASVGEAEWRIRDVGRTACRGLASSTPPRMESMPSPMGPASTRSGQRQGEKGLACPARSRRDQRRADSRGRPGDILSDGCGGDEPPAADQDAGELSGSEEPVNAVAGDAAEELSSFLDGVEHAVLHGSLGEGRGRPDVIRPSRQLSTVDRVVLTTLRGVAGKREEAT